MPINIKPASALSKKFANRAAAAAPDYAEGVKSPKRDQAESAIAAKDAFAQGVQAAIADDRFAKGVKAAGSEKWQRKALQVGAQRFPSGVQAAAPDWEKGTQPFLDTLSGLTLPPRLPKGDPANNQRVTVVTAALRAKKLAVG